MKTNKATSATSPMRLASGHGTTAAILGMTPKSRPTAKVPAKWAKHYRRLLELRARLQAGRIQHAAAASQPLENFSMDMADAATDEFDHALSLSALSAEQDALYEIDEALKRILAGTYGICELTGKPVPLKRLEALPWTRFGSEAERQLELQGEAYRPRVGELRSVMGPLTGNLEETQSEEERPQQAATDEALSRVLPSLGMELSGRQKQTHKHPPAKRSARRPHSKRHSGAKRRLKR